MRWRRCELKFDITGITKKQAAEVIADYFNTEYDYSSGHERYSVKDSFERLWIVNTADDIESEKMMNEKRIKGNFFYQTKITTPLLYERNMNSVEDILRNLELKGAFVNDTTKLTVNLDAMGLQSTQKFKENLERIQKSKEKLLLKVLDTDFNSIADTSKIADENMISFPIFKSTLNFDNVKSYIQLSQGIANYADRTKTISEKENLSPNDKFVMRTWLVRLGLVGEECKEAQKLFTKGLEGNSALLNKVDTAESDADDVAVTKAVTDDEMEYENESSEKTVIDVKEIGDEAQDIQEPEEEQEENNEPEFYGPSL